MLARPLIAVVLAMSLVVPAGAALAQDDGGEETGSLVERVLRVSDESLGAGAAAAVVRAYDRGYDLLQIVEGLIEGAVAEDGTIVDDDGALLAPFRPSSGVIEGDAGSVTAGFGVGLPPKHVISGGDVSGEAIALAVLERGITKATAKLDKKVDLEARADRAEVSDESLFTMLAVLTLIHRGYSPEQVIIDGFIAGGIRGVPGYPGILLVDEHGKEIKPDGVDEAPEQAEAEDQVDAFIDDVVDTLAGIPPSAGADTPFKALAQVDVEISFTGDGSATVVAKGKIGTPRDKSLRGFVVGNGSGEIAGAGECSVSEGGIVGDADLHPYEVSGPVRLGFSGSAKEGDVQLRLALVEVDATVAGDDSFCVDLLRDLADLYESLTFGPIDVRLKDGATGTATSTLGDGQIDVKVSIST